jgi:hypothetical protein
VVREGVGQGGEITQALYAHMNNKTTKIKESPPELYEKNKNKKIKSLGW